jgi:hypothetical protein
VEKVYFGVKQRFPAALRASRWNCRFLGLADITAQLLVL